MRNLKKLLAVIVSICVLATFTVPAFAADSTLSADTKTCADIGMLAGEGGGVTPEYGATVPTRVQALVMVLRLTGNLADAQAFTGTENFADASKASWAKSLLAYAKAHPELGFVGDGTNFNPTVEITPQEYYKVLLTALGYAIPADYAYADTLTFAKDTVKLAMAGDVENFTIDSLAVATVEGLKAKVKDGSKTLAAKLVDAGKLDKAAAVAAGLYVEAPEVVTVASVSADNLKQVVVAFNGAVDKDSAESVENYTIDGYTFESASLGDDGKTVTLTLDADNETVVTKGAFDNQKEYKITVDGVKDASGKTIAKADKVAFTPVDTTIPTVKELIPLGTKAIKVVFSEPVKKSSAATTAVFKIDGKSIAGSVDYIFADKAIIKTTVTTGEHKLSVDGVTDFYGLKVNVKDITFTVAEDTTAPEIVSAKATDLKKVEVVFNEPVKVNGVSKAYHTNSSKTAITPYGYDDTKVTLEFTDANKMSVGVTTVTLENVEDYSGNKATRTVDVTPVLDTERPTVTAVKVEKDGNIHKVTVTFSESVLNDTDNVKKGANYVFKDKDAKVVTGTGLNSKGSPSNSSISYNTSKKQATILLSGLLDAGDYTLEISGIQDTAYVANMMLPYTYSFTIGDTGAPTVKKVWAESTNPETGKYDSAIYVRFSEDMAIEGNGNVLDRSKYNYTIDSAATWRALPTDTTLEMVTPDTLKIVLPRSTDNLQVLADTLNKVQLRITLVSDTTGNFLASGSTENYIKVVALTPKGTIGINSAKATAKDTIEVEFDGVLTNIDAADFKVTTTPVSVTLDSYSIDDGKTTAIFKLSDDDKLLASVAASTVYFRAIDTDPDDIATQDAFGIKITTGAQATVTDGITPESVDYATDQAFDVTKTNATGVYTIKVKFDENIAINANLYDVLSVKIDGTSAQITNVTTSGVYLVITLGADTATKKPLKTDGVSTINNVSDTTSMFEVKLLPANADAKIITDTTGNKNSAVDFLRSAIGSEVVLHFN